jgi:hypothetical protein
MSSFKHYKETPIVSNLPLKITPTELATMDDKELGRLVRCKLQIAMLKENEQEEQNAKPNFDYGPKLANFTVQMKKRLDDNKWRNTPEGWQLRDPGKILLKIQQNLGNMAGNISKQHTPTIEQDALDIAIWSMICLDCTKTKYGEY